MTPRSTQDLLTLLQNDQYSQVIFDFDETLCHLKIEWKYLDVDYANLIEDLAEQEKNSQLSEHECIEYLIKKYGGEVRDRINALFRNCETNHLLGVVDNDALIAFLKSGKAAQTFHIISNNTKATLETQLKRLGMLEIFDQVIGRDSVQLPKPNPEGILKIIDSTQEDPKRFLMVGDSPRSDILAANRAGIASFLINMYLGT